MAEESKFDLYRMSVLKEERLYPLWKHSAEGLLEDFDLMKYARAANRTPRPADDHADFAAFRRKETKACRALYNSLCPVKFQSILLNIHTIDATWDAIMARFEGAGAQKSTRQQAKSLVKTVCGERENLVIYISQLNIRIKQLENQGHILDEEVKIGILFGLMPAYCRETERFLEETNCTNYTQACNAFARRFEEQLGNNSGSQPQGANSGTNQALITCYSCGENGHKSFNCPEKGNSDNNSVGRRMWCSRCKSNTHTNRTCRNKGGGRNNNNRNNRNGRRGGGRGGGKGNRFQANCVGSVDAFALITEFDGFLDSDNDSDLPPLIDVDETSSDEFDDEWDFDAADEPVAEPTLCNDTSFDFASLNFAPRDESDYEWDFEDNTDTDSFALVTGDGNNSSTGPFIDSACSVHMWNDRSNFIEYQPMHGRFITLGNDYRLPVLGKGKVLLQNVLSQINSTITLSDTLHVPELSKSLISVSALDDKGMEVIFDSGECNVFPNSSNEFLLKGCKVPGSRLYQLQFDSGEANLTDYQHDNDLELYHARMGHCSDGVLQKLTEVATGVEITNDTRPFCSDCPLGRMQRLPREQVSDNPAEMVLERIFCDLKGPVNPPTPSGYRYLVLFLDEFTSMKWGFLVKDRTDQLQVFKDFQSHIERFCDASIEEVPFVRTDGAREFDESFRSYLISKGIAHELRAADQPQQMGKVEVCFRVLFNMVRCMLKSSNTPNTMWGQAALSAIFLLNRLPTSSNPGFITPFEMFYGDKPDLSKIRAWGSECYAHSESPALGDRATKCKLIGFEGDQPHAYRLLNLSTNRVLLRRNVIFNESSVLESATRPMDSIDLDSDGNAASSDTIVAEGPELPPDPVPQQTTPAPIDVPEPLPQPRRSSRPPQPRDFLSFSTRFDDNGFDIEGSKQNDIAFQILGSCFAVSDEFEPGSYNEAINCPEAPKWIEAMGEEHSALGSNDTWELVERPPDANVLKCKWVFKLKRNAQGTIVRYKARLVVCGYAMEHGIDFFETFSPVAKMQTIRLLFFLAAQFNCHMEQFDIPNAYVKAAVDEDIFIAQPEGFVDPDLPDAVLKLKKALYGLKQAGRNWNQYFKEFLLSLGLIQCNSDPCLYFMVMEGSFVIVVIYVDDVLALSPDTEAVEHIVQAADKAFNIARMGFPKWFLGIRISKDGASTIFLDQSRAVMDLLKKPEFQGLSPNQVPMSAKTQLLRLQEGQAPTSAPFRSNIGSMMYLMNTRPDLSVSMSKLGQFLAQPSPDHYLAAKKVIRYLKGTADYGLKFAAQESIDMENCIVAFSDSDWATDLNDRKSFSGFAVYVGCCLISWKCRKQPTVALSTAEAEYLALTLAASEVLWLRDLLAELGYLQKSASTIFCDNLGTIHIANNDVVTPKVKHIAMRHHFLKENIAAGKIKIEYIPTADNIADFMTKPLEGKQFAKFRKQLMLERVIGL